MTTWFLVTARESLFFRANLNFGGAGEWGSSVMPPAPSVFAGAFRSAILGAEAGRLDAYARLGRTGDRAIDEVLGVMPVPGRSRHAEPEESGTFRLAWSSLAWVKAGITEALLAQPRDLSAFRIEGEAADRLDLAAVEPSALPGGVQTSGELPLRALLRYAGLGKPSEGHWLTPRAATAWACGELPPADELVKGSALFLRDPRLGIGLDAATRSAEEGLLYTTDGQALSCKGDEVVGFLIGLYGLGDTREILGSQGLLRLGGDGRCARYERIDEPLLPKAVSAETINADRRFRITLRSPALSSEGWVPPLVTRSEGCEEWRLSGPGGAFRARLCCASVGRPEVLGGWDLHAWQPKPSRRAAPVGSVYWFDEFEGDATKLLAWIDGGMPGDPDESPARRAEGHGQALIGRWRAP